MLEVALDPDRERRWSRGLEIARRLELCTNPKASAAALSAASRACVCRLRKYTVLVVLLLAGLPNIRGERISLRAQRVATDDRADARYSTRSFERTQLTISGDRVWLGAVLFFYLGFFGLSRL